MSAKVVGKSVGYEQAEMCAEARESIAHEGVVLFVFNNASNHVASANVTAHSAIGVNETDDRYARMCIEQRLESIANGTPKIS